MKQTQNKPSYSQLIKNNPSGYICRKDLSEKTGGLLHGRTMANLDSDAGAKGIQGRIKIGKRKVAYPVHEVIKYLQKQTQVLTQNSSPKTVSKLTGEKL